MTDVLPSLFGRLVADHVTADAVLPDESFLANVTGIRFLFVWQMNHAMCFKEARPGHDIVADVAPGRRGT